MSNHESGTTRRGAWLQFALLAALFALLMARTWGKWPDSVVDFGRELYAPWRLSAGDVLYRELAWFNGPLSPYWNALCFELFGVGLATLVWVNAALFAAILALLHAALRSFTSSWAATCACALVIACCGFAQLVGIGNYNYITPYSHEATHGVLLTLGALISALRWTASRRLAWSALCGACVGAALLTKPEMALAALLAGVSGLAFTAWQARVELGAQLRALAVFSAGAAAVVALAFAGLASALGAAEAWRGVLGAWPSLATSDVAELAFYKRGMGLDAPADNLLVMLTWCGRWAALVAILAGLAALARRAPGWLGVAVLLPLGAGAAYALVSWTRLSEVARGWPLLALAVLASSALALARRTGSPRDAARAAFALAALVLLAKMALNVRISHYGFALAMPATALLAALALDALPHALARWVSAPALRAGLAGALATLGVLHIVTTERVHAMKQQILGRGADEFRADVRGTILEAVLGWLERSNEPGAAPRTLAVFPEGVTLNYLARLENPTPFINFMPPEIVLFGEERMLAAFRANPPDVVVITHKDTSEYGYRFFGVDYARELGAWLRAEYQAVQVFGDPPLQPNSRFGAAVLVRKR